MHRRRRARRRPIISRAGVAPRLLMRMSMNPTHLSFLGCLGCLALLAAGCGGAGAKATHTDAGFDAGPSCATVPTYGQLLIATFVPRCSGRCHGGALMPPTPTSPAGPIDLSASSTRD